jgi:GTPase SAR1 family protein
MSLDYFSFDKAAAELERFARDVPAILAGHALTADLSAGLEFLSDRVETPFAVAVVGQMRVGKSTLLNALVGQDLAITGVNETTATLNWLKYGQGDVTTKFKVVWKNKPEEFLPKNRINEWVGDSVLARQTRCIEFFADAEVLKKAYFIDTPGMRSVIADHEDVTTEFLAAKLDRNSHQQGDSADAIIYVLPATARETDQSTLEDFSNSRIPGSSPVNSIAVLHKWDSIEELYPFDIVNEKAARLRADFSELVSDVIPVSAPLYIAAERFAIHFWDTVSLLASIDEDESFCDLVSDPEEFVELDEASIPVTVEDRQRLVQEFPIPWASLRMILRHARSRGIISGEELRNEIRHRSGIPALNNEIETRFFSRRRLIKMMSAISRAWEPCNSAVVRLRNEKKITARKIDEIPVYTSTLAGISGVTSAQRDILENISDFLADQKTDLQEQLEKSSVSLASLDATSSVIKELHAAMDNDIRGLELLDEENVPMNEKDASRCRALFGFHGPDLDSRISPWVDSGDRDGVCLDLEMFRRSLISYRNRSELSALLKHAETRIEQILDMLEAQPEQP